MDVLVLIDKLDDLVHNAKLVPMTGQVRVDKDEIYDILDQMRATIPEEIKQARWIVKERQEMRRRGQARGRADRQGGARAPEPARQPGKRSPSRERARRRGHRRGRPCARSARFAWRRGYADEILNTLRSTVEVHRGRSAGARTPAGQGRPAKSAEATPQSGALPDRNPSTPRVRQR